MNLTCSWSTTIMGNPICLVHEPITAAMGFPLASSRQSHRSSAENTQKLAWSQTHALYISCTFSPVEAFLCWNFRRYAFIPFLKSYKDKDVKRDEKIYQNKKGGQANLISNVVVQHANHRRSFTVRDGVKDFIHLWWMAHVHLARNRKGVVSLRTNPNLPWRKSCIQPRWGDCCPKRPGPEHGCSLPTRTGSRCRILGSSDPRTGTRSTMRILH